ncbi:TetR/AcrR family transcriptional regulator [Armatimonas sp.]|uniref:TetR/AcrR family transcriptional regulator n=1 Tax=Armatimonas sp. TaxID=1872638 RepID=UPI00286D5C27|nr:TetR/AcrR family transcriptional regulator [Armatimonas sp.]
MGNRKATREHILEIALRLFNEQGCHATTTNHIAEAAGLSVGNLYYHFKNKEEIVRALYERLSADTQAAFVLPTDRLPDLTDLERLMRVNFTILWEYRFFYREIMALLQRDPQLAAQYRALRERGFQNFTVLFQQFHASGIFRPATTTEIDQLAEICWILSEFYLPFVEIGGEAPNPAHLDHGVVLLRQALTPYLETK